MKALKPVFKNQHLNGDGFILLEIMVSVSIIAIVFVALFRMQSSTIDLAATGKFNSIAPFLAQMQLSRIEADLSEWSETSGNFGEDFKGYEWTCSLSDLSIENEDFIEKKRLETLKRIDLTITSHSENKLYKMTTWCFSDKNE